MRANAYETRDNIGAATSGISVQRAISRFEAVTQIWRPCLHVPELQVRAWQTQRQTESNKLCDFKVCRLTK